MRYRPIEERFAEKYEVDSKTGCWNWTGATIAGGYGHLGRYRAEPILAHRFSYEHHKGPVPGGHIVRHTCHNSKCVNPDHLVAGTHADNMADMARAGRRIGRNTGFSFPQHVLARMKKLLAEGKTQVEVASKLKLNRSTVQRAIYRGEVHAQTSTQTKQRRVYLTAKQRAQVVLMLERRVPVMTIAARFGVDRRTIRKLRPDHLPHSPRGRPKGTSK